jgi:hypothetical protein
MAQLTNYSVAGAFSVLVAAVAFLRRAPRGNTEQMETARQRRILATGRITDGAVIDVQELDSATDHGRQIIMYAYDVAGVHYDCSQDVTLLRPWVDLHSCRIGVATSVRYDPQNPGDSIVVAEHWCGPYS